MAHWSERLKQLMVEKGWGTVVLARRSGVDAESIYKYRRGLTDAPRGRTLDKLAEALGVTAAYLEYGVSNEKNVSQSVAPQRLPCHSMPVVRPTKLYDLWGRGSAVIEENALFFEPRTGDVGPSAFGLVVDNDAMAPVIPHGATLVVDPDAPLAPGAYVVAMSTQLRAVIVRRLRMPSPAAYPIELRAENADHPDVTLRSEADGMVIGRAVRVIHTI